VQLGQNISNVYVCLFVICEDCFWFNTSKAQSTAFVAKIYFVSFTLFFPNECIEVNGANVTFVLQKHFH